MPTKPTRRGFLGAVIAGATAYTTRPAAENCPSCGAPPSNTPCCPYCGRANRPVGHVEPEPTDPPLPRYGIVSSYAVSSMCVTDADFNDHRGWGMYGSGAFTPPLDRPRRR